MLAHSAGTTWSFEPLQLVPLALGAALYAKRVRTLSRRGTPVAWWRPVLFGLGVLVLVLLAYFIRGNPVPGFPFLASIIAIFSGAQLFALGILGEYLGRMHMRTMDRPAYIVRTATARLDA